MKISKSITNVGINDENIRIFENQYNVPDGMTYNSYVIKDKKITILDTIDVKEQEEWMKNIKTKLKGETPYYLIISHLEPDHSGSISKFIKEYPDVTLIGNKKTFEMLPQFIKVPTGIKMQEVKEGETLDLGKHKLEFYMAPMVHWPEVMVTYEKTEKILFSADAFGKFGAVKEGNDTEAKSKESTEEIEWESEARRYYFGIVGKYGMQVQLLLKKLANKEIKTICPLHGPTISENLKFYLEKYNQWSTYTAEKDATLIICASIYGHTLEAAKLLKAEIERKNNNKNIVIENETCADRNNQETKLLDLTKCDMYEAVSEAFEYKTIVLAAASYNMNVFPPMEELLNKLKDRNYQNRRVAIIENGSWAPSAAKAMKEILTKMKDIEIIEPLITIKTSLSEENKKEIQQIAEKLIK